MKKLLLILLCLPMIGFGQTYYKCATDEMSKIYLNNNNKHKLNKTKDHLTQKGNTNYIIPVVFHVNDSSDPQKVTYPQIQSAINILNEDFNGNNPEFNSLDPLFQDIAANIEITFCLASKDPSGLTTTGVTYHYNNYHGMDPLLKSISVWPCDRYLNIWIVNEPFDDGSTNQSGYATYPSTFNANQGTDGIVYNHRYLGYGLGSTSISSPSHWQAYMARVLTHEVGHYLNLRHTFQNACLFPDDGVIDTPPVDFYGTSTHPCPDSSIICSGYVAVNNENFMDYSKCYSMFTEGQKVRMINALNSNNGYRNNLWSVNNLIFTGCNNITDITTIISMTNKKIIKVTDLFGRENKGTKNKVLFYIYDDGTVEKRIVIE
jgi:hypothetical protein